MRCSDCKRELKVGERHIAFGTAQRHAVVWQVAVAHIFDLGYGDKIVCCEDCMRAGGDFQLETVYGDEDD
jgi:hypothetical protein